jgi:hypothetical protein
VFACEWAAMPGDGVILRGGVRNQSTLYTSRNSDVQTLNLTAAYNQSQNTLGGSSKSLSGRESKRHPTPQVEADIDCTEAQNFDRL